MLSCTDKKCQWKDGHSRLLKQYDPAPIDQHPCFSDIKKKKKSECSAEQTVDTFNVDDVDDEEVFAQLVATQAIKRKKPDNVKDLTKEQTEAAIKKVVENLKDSAFVKHL